jgi:hypothetical protein
VERLVASAFDLAGRDEAWVDRVSNLGDDDEVLDGALRRFGIGPGLIGPNQPGDALSVRAGGPDDAPQVRVDALRRLPAWREEADLVALANRAAV